MRCRDDFEWPWYPLEGEDFSSSCHFRINSTQPYDFVCSVLASLSYVNNVVAWGDDADGDEEDDGGDCHCAVSGRWGFVVVGFWGTPSSTKDSALAVPSTPETNSNHKP